MASSFYGIALGERPGGGARGENYALRTFFHAVRPLKLAAIGRFLSNRALVIVHVIPAGRDEKKNIARQENMISISRARVRKTRCFFFLSI